MEINNLIIIFIVGLVFFRTAVADWSYVPNGSMEPTFYNGDYMLVNKTSYAHQYLLLISD